MTGQQGPVVRLLGAAVTYPGPPPVPALRPTDLTIGVGEYVAITGRSGSGKSTLLNILGLLDRPTAGSVEIAGTDAGALPENDRSALRGQSIGFVFQAFHLMPYRTALENVALGLLYRGMNPKVREERAVEALQRVGLGHRVSAVPARLSGGERQRVAVARAIVGQPVILLCDEPTGNLDMATGTEILNLIDELHTDGMTVVLVTHDPAAADRAGRLLHVTDGLVETSTSGEPYPASPNVPAERP